MPLPEDVLAPQDLAALRADYESGAGALTVLAARFAITPAALASLARRLNFGARPPLAPFQRRAPPGEAPPPPAQNKAPSPKKAPAGKPGAAAKREAAKAKPAKRKGAASTSAQPKPADPAPNPAAPLKPLDMQAMAERLRQAASRELVKINDQLEAGADVERHARVLASLVKTLGDLARLSEARGAAPAGDADGWSLDDLRRTLARRIDALAPDEPAQ
jgi:hypothetical protein